jgi:predicted AlkP superfamily pyrophosphatase or phosphodiesterase
MNARSLRRCLLLLLSPLAAAAFSRAPQAQEAPRPRPDRQVVLITIDGCGADNLDDPRLPLPNIRRLADEGARADRMTVVTPSVTWPNHTTLVTGVRPDKHGVVVNGLVEPSTGDRPLIVNARRTKDELCRYPTLYDIAKQAGLTTAEVNWPVTRGAKTLDWSLPDVPDRMAYTTPTLLEELKQERIFLNPTNEAFTALGSVGQDELWAQTAVHLIQKHRPNLLLYHILLPDSFQHVHGPQTQEAYAALSLADRHVGEIAAALGGGLKTKSTVIVTADHGFGRIAKLIQPNARLRAEGLIRPGADGGSMEWDAQVVPDGGVALVYIPAARLKPELVAQVKDALTDLEGVERVVGPEEYGPLGIPTPQKSPQGPHFLLAAKDGYSFGDAVTGWEIVPARRFGSHGYVASNPKMDAVFVASGAAIRKGVRLNRVSSLDVAPTIARILGLDLPGIDGKPIDGILAP